MNADERRIGLLAVAALIADGLPTPDLISLYDHSPGPDLSFKSNADQRLWIDRLGGAAGDERVYKPDWHETEIRTLHSQAEYHGVRLGFRSWDPVTSAPDPLAPVESADADRVRAALAEDLTPGVGEVAGPDGRSGPATAPGGAGVA